MLSSTSIVRRTLGLDWGEKRIGVAASDPLGLTAGTVGAVYVRKDGSHFEEIAGLVRTQDAERVVVGVPWSDDGSANASTRKALAFADALKEKLAVPVETCDESYTTDEANRILKERGVSWKASKSQVDAIAAAVMLQGWLESRPKTPPTPRSDDELEDEA